ncbi:MAG: hypoxanthine phosphoribosyltransferase [Firmicutes bacterium]|jgi:hypoxanthine phosphoribosyltransferase|nr:hypoxanthine phosphoribosyltransferase [Bacillota bacterium]
MPVQGGASITDDIQEVIVSKEQIDEKVGALGRQISQDYEGSELLLVCILKGALVFTADLMRSITVPIHTDFMAVTSYGAATRSSGVVKIVKDLDIPIEGKHVLIVEDIIDTGLTLNYLLSNLRSRKPASVRVCTLLDKPERREVPITPDYNGFSIPDRFVVGYGLDYREKYRNLPFVGVLKEYVWNGGASK